MIDLRGLSGRDPDGPRAPFQEAFFSAVPRRGREAQIRPLPGTPVLGLRPAHSRSGPPAHAGQAAVLAFERRALAEASARRLKWALFRCAATRAICSSVASGCSSLACRSKRPFAAARAFAVRLAGSSVFAQLVCAARLARTDRSCGFMSLPLHFIPILE